MSMQFNNTATAVYELAGIQQRSCFSLLP